MKDVTRRDAIRLATAAGAAAVVGSAAAAAGQSPQKSDCNNEAPVHSTATPDHCGPRELFAVVDEAGNLKRGFHVASCRRLERGVYEVIFNRDVRRGVYLVTPGGHGYQGVPPTAIASVTGRASNPHGVLVYIADTEGDPLATGFHLLVVCPDGFA